MAWRGGVGDNTVSGIQCALLVWDTFCGYMHLTPSLLIRVMLAECLAEFLLLMS